MSAVLQIEVSPSLYVRNPTETELGRGIVGRGIELIDRMGFASFTFRHLAKVLKTSEASVYRYFKNKNQFLHYAFSWYWSWLEFCVIFRTVNITDPSERLSQLLELLSETVKDDPNVPYINEIVLHRVVVSESQNPQIAFTRKTSKKDGPAVAYESLITLLAKIIKDCSPSFTFPRALALTLVTSTHEQRYLARYFPGISEIGADKNEDALRMEFLRLLTFSTLGVKAPKRLGVA